MNSARNAQQAAACALTSGRVVDVVLYGAGDGGADVAVDVSFVCAEASDLTFETAIKKREELKNSIYLDCENSASSGNSWRVLAHAH